MLIAEAQLDTEHASRYLVQLGKHASAMAGRGGHSGGLWRHGRGGGGQQGRQEMQVHAEWSPTHAVLRFDPLGQCTIDATTATLTLRIEANDETGLQQIQDVVTQNLERFGRRDHLTVHWWGAASMPRPPD